MTSRRRKILHGALEYAVELELLDKHPIPALKWTPPQTTHSVDRRRVANPIQVRTLLHAHIQEFGAPPDGRLFVGERNGGELPTMTMGRVWRRARPAAFTAEAAASPLAKAPYDLRHAAVSTWLNGGVPPTTVAEWAVPSRTHERRRTHHRPGWFARVR